MQGSVSAFLQTAARLCQSKRGWCGTGRSVAFAEEKTVPLFQELARGDPPHGDAVHPLPATRCCCARSRTYCSNPSPSANVSVHSQIKCSAALAEWRQLAAW